MKTKTFNKKLVLNKSTVADLGSGRMNKVKGGSPTNDCTTQAGHICEDTCNPTTAVPCKITCNC